MYKLTVRNYKNTGHGIMYDEKKSRLHWHIGAPVKFGSIETEDEVVSDFIESISSGRLIESLPNYGSFREECLHCPVVQLCKGVSLDKPADQFKMDCDAAYIFYVDRLYWGIFALTYTKLENIEGDIWRPE